MSTPLADVQAEAARVLAACDAAGITVRLLGGVAVAQHRHGALPGVLDRNYGDIDVVLGPKDVKRFRSTLTALGYCDNVRFNNLRGDRRLLFDDEVNGRKFDGFVGGFSMCHSLGLSGRLGIHPSTLCAADLLLTKLQVVQLTHKDIVDCLTLLLTHSLTETADRDFIDQSRFNSVVATDWGWYTTVTDNLVTVRARADLLDADAAEQVRSMIDQLTQGLRDEPKSLRFKARDRVGRRLSWYELPEEFGAPAHA